MIDISVTAVLTDKTECTFIWPSLLHWQEVSAVVGEWVDDRFLSDHIFVGLQTNTVWTDR